VRKSLYADEVRKIRSSKIKMSRDSELELVAAHFGLARN
jgi:hypothetical protein